MHLWKRTPGLIFRKGRTLHVGDQQSSLGEIILFPAMSDAVATLAPPDRRGKYMGLMSLTFAAALALGPWLCTHQRQADIQETTITLYFLTFCHDGGGSLRVSLS